MNHLIVVVGPTAVGKTELSVRLARHFGAEILSADARQLYREMTVGTARPTPAEQGGVPHHFIASHAVDEGYSVGQYETDALARLGQLYQRHPVALLTGGAGLYVRAVVRGLDPLPPAAPACRAALEQRLAREGLAPLAPELTALDPAYAAGADLCNPRRVVRALEVCLASGRPFSSFRRDAPAPRPFQVHQIGLTRPRQELYARIDQRVEAMLAAGLTQEAEALFDRRHLPALQTVGYQEIFGWMEGNYGWEEAVRLLKRNSRRYAKRQLTWFRRDETVCWFDAGAYEETVAWLETRVGSPGA